MAHIVNAMNKVLRDCIPDITMPFLDDIPIKGCLVEEKDETIGPDGCQTGWMVGTSRRRPYPR